MSADVGSATRTQRAPSTPEQENVSPSCPFSFRPRVPPPPTAGFLIFTCQRPPESTFFGFCAPPDSSSPRIWIDPDRWPSLLKCCEGPPTPGKPTRTFLERRLADLNFWSRNTWVWGRTYLTVLHAQSKGRRSEGETTNHSHTYGRAEQAPELFVLGAMKMMVRRNRDAEAELNLPPGFRFHPTDEELVVHYLCRRATHQPLPVPIIAEIDLYKYDPWLLPDMAFFGQKEWYFFTPRDRKYPNGTRPNRAAGGGYWKATGADKPITPATCGRPVGIKKALVFYSGKAPKGTKTNWIMHEYRLADANRPATKKGSLRLDDWVLCRLYNKKNNWENEIRTATREVSSMDTMSVSFEEAPSDSHRTLESDVDNDVHTEINGHQPMMNSQAMRSNAVASTALCAKIKEDNDWFTELNLDDLQNPFTAVTTAPPTSADINSYQDYFLAGIPSPALPRIPSQSIMPF